MADCNSTTQTDCETKTRKPPTCPDCGALECLCRPRFFAGQLLSEQDLNRLDQYMKKKNRLHNRNLHGWGVVNGLMVLCDPCAQIKVTKGYAVDPCGDDIVVCEDTTVDICKLIRQCKEKERQDLQCLPYQRSPNSNCNDLEEEWILAVRYCEWPSRGITALRNTGCRCGKSSGTCTCGGGAAACGCDSSLRTKPRSTPPECEPTITCEGYAFEVYRKPQQDPSPNDQKIRFGGALVERFNCCWQALGDAVPIVPGDFSTSPENILANRDAWQLWCCQTRENLIQYYRNRDSTNCQLLQALACIICPDPNTLDNETFVARMQATFMELGFIILEGMVDCICLALLPPPPEASHDSRVPLASVKVRARDCQIISVCNWTMERKFMTTWPTMCYWWSLFPIGRWLHQALEQVCCREYARPNCDRQDTDNANTGVVGMVDTSTGGINASGNFSSLAMLRMNPSFNFANEAGAYADMASLSVARGKQPLNPWSVISSVTRMNINTDAPALTDVERENLPQFLAMNMFARPMGMAAMQPSTLMNVLGAITDITEEADLGAFSGFSAADNAELMTRLDRMEQKLKAQEKTINSLKAKKK